MPRPQSAAGWKRDLTAGGKRRVYNGGTPHAEGPQHSEQRLGVGGPEIHSCPAMSPGRGKDRAPSRPHQGLGGPASRQGTGRKSRGLARAAIAKARGHVQRAHARPLLLHTPRAPPPSRARRPLCLRAAVTPPQRSPTNERPARGGRGARPLHGCARGTSPACVCVRRAARLRIVPPAAQRTRGGGLGAHARCGRRGPAGRRGGPRMRAACPPLASSRGGGGGGGSGRGSVREVRGAVAAPVSGRTARRRRERPGGGGT